MKKKERGCNERLVENKGGERSCRATLYKDFELKHSGI